MDHEQLTELVGRFLSGESAAQYLEQSLPCVNLSQPSEGSGAMRLGGSPSALHRDWPLWKGAALNFLAELDLAAISDLESNLTLPPLGMLSFFYAAEEQPWGIEPSDQGAWRVIYTEPEMGAPTEAPSPIRTFDQVAVDGLQASSGPWSSEAAVRPINKSESRGVARLMDALGAGGFHSGGHQVGGWPVLQQDSLWHQVQLLSNGFVSANEDGADAALCDAAGWVLLLQLDGDDRAGWMWGDGGTLYFVVREADLIRQNFDDVWCFLQT